MSKKKIRSGTYLYPMAVVLVGANVKNKANFMPIAWTCIVEHAPPTLMIVPSKNHYTNIGIKENSTFSINTITEDLMEISDYCGIVSGKDIDKSKLFEVFYGELKTAPMIEESPLNLECKLDKHIEYKGHDLFFGEIIQAYAEEEILKGAIPDITKLHPLIFSMNDNNYWKLGEHMGRAWSIGKNFKK
jgi:flavin reductase (DIM6/NTAB) family NADH-FMN oxidoreductase RutF